MVVVVTASVVVTGTVVGATVVGTDVSAVSPPPPQAARTKQATSVNAVEFPTIFFLDVRFTVFSLSCS